MLGPVGVANNDLRPILSNGGENGVVDRQCSTDNFGHTVGFTEGAETIESFSNPFA